MGIRRPRGVVPHVTRLDPLDEATRVLGRAVDLRPELVLVSVVVPLESGDAIFAPRWRARASRLPVHGQCAVEAAERLDPDEVAQDEHVSGIWA